MSSAVITQALVPMIAFYIVIMVVLAAGLRMSRRTARKAGPAAAPEPSRTAGGSPASAAGPGASLAAGAPAGASGTGPSLASAAPPGAPGPGPDRTDGRTLLRPGPGWPQLIMQYARTVLGGYLLLMAVVVIYYFGVARVGGNFIQSAFTGCALLIGLSTPVFFLVSWLTTRRN